MTLFELFVKIGADTSGVEKGLKQAKKSAADYRKDVMNLAQTYKKQGMDMSSAMKKAYSEIDKSQYETSQKSKKNASKFALNWEEAGEKIGKVASKIGKGLKVAAKAGTVAVTAAATGIATLTTVAVKNYAEYEQLVGGVDTLFKDASQKVQQYASEAYRTSGMSANEYMANATAFSASLISALGDDTEATAEYANRAMVSMSDNANKMGTNIDSIVQTYQSLARGNFAMLDNLKLGYGGTKAELERLIADAASYTEIQKEMGITVDASSTSFDNIVNAIAVVQGKLGIAGATALEAGTTIEGSVNSMKAAWDNLITGVANKNADLEVLINNLVTSIVGDGTESNLGVLGNIMPAVKQALNGASKLVQGLLPKIVQEIPSIINDNLPILAEAAISIIQSLVDGISQNQEMLMTTAFNTIKYLATSLITMLPDIIQVGIDLIFSRIDGITEMISDPVFVQSIIDVVLKIVDILTNPDTIVNLLNAAVTLIVALAKGLIQALPQLLAKVPEIISNLVKAFGQFLKPVTDIGKNIVDGIKQGISNAWKNLVSWFKGLFGDLIGIAEKILGIASPSKVFKKIGGFTAEGFGEGFKDVFEDVEDDVANALDFSDTSYGFSTSTTSVGDFDKRYRGSGIGGVQNVNVTVGIDDSANAMGLARALLPFLKIAEKEVYA